MTINNLATLFQSQPNAARLICNFLDNKDIASLDQTCKTIHNKLNHEQINKIICNNLGCNQHLPNCDTWAKTKLELKHKLIPCLKGEFEIKWKAVSESIVPPFNKNTIRLDCLHLNQDTDFIVLNNSLSLLLYKNEKEMYVIENWSQTWQGHTEFPFISHYKLNNNQPTLFGGGDFRLNEATGVPLGMSMLFNDRVVVTTTGQSLTFWDCEKYTHLKTISLDEDKIAYRLRTDGVSIFVYSVKDGETDENEETDENDVLLGTWHQGDIGIEVNKQVDQKKKQKCITF